MAPPLIAVVPPLTETDDRTKLEPTAALKVVVPVLVTVNDPSLGAFWLSTVPVNVVFPVPSLTVRS